MEKIDLDFHTESVWMTLLKAVKPYYKGLVMIGALISAAVAAVGLVDLWYARKAEFDDMRCKHWRLLVILDSNRIIGDEERTVRMFEITSGENKLDRKNSSPQDAAKKAIQHEAKLVLDASMRRKKAAEDKLSEAVNERDYFNCGSKGEKQIAKK